MLIPRKKCPSPTLTYKTPYTAEQKRERRAQQAQAAGKPYKARIKKPPQQLLHKPTNRALLVSPEDPILTVEEEMNRARMEAEDLRSQMMRQMAASNHLDMFYKNWLQVGQIVDIKPIARKMLGFPEKENYIRFKLVKQNSQGHWQLRATKGPNFGKDLWINLPEEMLC